MISLQVGDCWLWSLIFQIQRYYSVVIVTQEYCTLVPLALGSGAVPQKRGFGGEAPDKCFWDVCWPIVSRTHGIGLIVVFSHGISPIKEKHCNMAMYGIVLYCSIVNNLCDCVRETMRELRGSATVFLQVISLYLSGL